MHQLLQLTINCSLATNLMRQGLEFRGICMVEDEMIGQVFTKTDNVRALITCSLTNQLP